MSCWTHIVASININTYKEYHNIKQWVEGELVNAPKITGSEGNADIFVNVANGYNVFISDDCNSCKYKDTIEFFDDESFSCDANEDYSCPNGEYQTEVVITILSHLRDRLKEQTLNEYKKFINYLKKDCNFEIRNSSFTIAS